MFENRPPSFEPRSALVSIISLALLTAFAPVHAKSFYTSTWDGLYPSSSSGTNAGCALCHLTTSGSGLNTYGEHIADSSAGSLTNRILDVQSVNSDSDPTGSDNLTEINANSQPGWTGSAPPGVFGDLDPVSNAAPTADAGGPYEGTVGVSVVFDASYSSDSDGSIVQYDWDFGDGSTVSDAGSAPEHTYTTAGTYTVTLTVTDDDSDSDSATSSAIIGPAVDPPDEYGESHWLRGPRPDRIYPGLPPRPPLHILKETR